MRTHDFLVGDGVDFSRVDERMSGLLDRSARWLGHEDAHRARLGLHELLVNIRRHSYRGGTGPISVAMTASPAAVTVLVTDWGGTLPVGALPDASQGARPSLSGDGGYGLAIIDQVFSDVEYRRACGRNEWVLSVDAADVPER
ncbi:ATP-binding protein [Microbacterium sp. NPDC077184]|uniref:ATP-binding protein n=1 Tax=Microbacterium sp. NPDC077184 TaxID=3154764 RepID=UPI00343986CA